jgi:hypothetical protein
MHSEVSEKVLAGIEAGLPEIVLRKVLSAALGNLLAPRTFANLDALGKGIGVKIKINRSVAYPKQAVMDWLRKNLTVTDH